MQSASEQFTEDEIQIISKHKNGLDLPVLRKLQ